MRSRAATGLWPVRGWAADPRVVVGRPEREEGEEGVGEAVEAITEVPLESAPEIRGVGRGVGGVEGCAEGCAARAWEVAEEGDGEEREDDEDEEEHEHEVTQRGHRQQDLPCDRAGVARRRRRGGRRGHGPRRQSVLESRAGVQSKGAEQGRRARVQSRGAEQGCRAGVQSRGAEQGRRAGVQSRGAEQGCRAGVQSRGAERGGACGVAPLGCNVGPPCRRIARGGRAAAYRSGETGRRVWRLRW